MEEHGACTWNKNTRDISDVERINAVLIQKKTITFARHNNQRIFP